MTEPVINTTQKLGETAVCIFDLVEYSQKPPDVQSRLVSRFVNQLDDCIAEIEDLQPLTYSNGDGAVISVNRKDGFDAKTLEQFMDFVIESTLYMWENRVEVSTSVNSAEDEQCVVVEKSSSIDGGTIQTGHAVNTSTRLLNFCEPGEIILGQDIVDELIDAEIKNRYPTTPNGEFLVKHGETINSHTYEPQTEEERDHLYSPEDPSHLFKKYRYFPTIGGQIIERLDEMGLEEELESVVNDRFQFMDNLEKTKRFISWRPVTDVLTQINYDPNENVYVLSRVDNTEHFWSQEDIDDYVEYLSEKAEKYGGSINQQRIRVAHQSRQRHEEDIEDHGLSSELRKLHPPNTYYACRPVDLQRYSELSRLQYGFTAFEKSEVAIISVPMPATEAVNHQVHFNDAGSLLNHYEEYDVNKGMRAVVTANEIYVEKLIRQMKRLMSDDIGVLK